MHTDFTLWKALQLCVSLCIVLAFSSASILASESIELTRSDGTEVGRFLRLNAISASVPVGAYSDDIPVRSLCRYSIEAEVRRIAGDGRYNLALEWLDSNRKHLSYVNSWMGLLVGDAWEPHRFESTSPESAHFARVLLEMGVGGDGFIRDVRLSPLPTSSTQLAIDLLASPTSLTIRLENRGEIKTCAIDVLINLPSGMKTSSTTSFSAGDLSYGQSFIRKIGLEGSPVSLTDPIRVTAAVKTVDGNQIFEGTTRPWVLNAKEKITPTKELVVPVVPETVIKLGAFYFPVMLDWDRGGWGVRKVPYLRPKLGFYDETSPKVADWHIAWAIEHGIQYFVFDTYFNKGFAYLSDALDKGFLGSRFADKMEFCVDWCNEGQASEFKSVDFSDASLESFIQMMCRKYFKRKNYLRVDGKPVVLIHLPARIVNAHQNWAGCKEALERMREIAESYGHPGVYFVAVHTNTPNILDYQKGGWDAVTAYAYGFQDVSWDRTTRSLPYESLIPRHRECFEIAKSQALKRGLDYIPTAWVGWDDAARSNQSAIRTAGNIPAAFRSMVAMLPEYVTRPKLALFESWNEWGEGGQAEPDELYGFGRLSAIRDILLSQAGPYTVAVPSDSEKLTWESKMTMDDVNDHYYLHYARSLNLSQGFEINFDTPLGLSLLPANCISDTHGYGGKLCANSNGDDPYFISPPALEIPSREITRVVVRMQTSAGTMAQLFWNTRQDRSWSESRSLRVPLVSDGQFRDYIFDVSKCKPRVGKIWQFRFDPTDTPAKIAIDNFFVGSTRRNDLGL